MIKDISSFIESQFPNIYKQEGQQFVAFVKAYYEWLETKFDDNLLDGFDPDRSVDAFLDNFKKTYLTGFPFVKSSSVDFLVKHIYDYYQSKGTEESVKLLIMMMFGEQASVFKPSEYILKPSASKWVEPRYIEVESNKSNYDLVWKEIVGIRSGARAIVESVVTKVMKGRFIDVIYISNLKGSFQTGEKVSHDGNINTAPTIIGSLTSVEILNGGRNFSVGDILDIDSTYGMGGKVRVKSVINSTGRVDFELIDGGSGYTTTPTTDVYISDGIIFCDNDPEGYIELETVYQKIERLGILSIGTAEPLLTTGRVIVGVDENGSQVSSGRLIDRVTTDDGDFIKIAIDSGTFMNQRRWSVPQAAAHLQVGSVIEKSKTFTLTVPDGSIFSNGAFDVVQSFSNNVPYSSAVLTLSTSVSFAVGEEVKQETADGILIMTGEVLSSKGTRLVVGKIRNFNGGVGVVTTRPITNSTSSKTATVTVIDAGVAATVSTHYIKGKLVAVSGNEITVEDCNGNFTTEYPIVINGISSPVSVADLTSEPARATVSSIISPSNVSVEVHLGNFGSSGTIFVEKTKGVIAFTDLANIGATDIWYDNISTANSIIDISEDWTISGLVVGQNTSAIGVWGNTEPFVTTDDMVDEGSSIFSSNMNVASANRLRVTFNDPHSFAAGDFVKSEINIQNSNEVVMIDDVFQIVSTTPTSILLAIPNPTFESFSGQFVAFPSKFSETFIVSFTTDRSKMISPPRNPLTNEIIEIRSYGLKSSKGTGANFNIGSIENDEVVFLETDFLKDLNVSGFPFMDVRLDGSNSGVGFVEGFYVNAGGTNYANGAIITLSGGGLSNSEPRRQAQGVIVTDGTGSIDFIHMQDHGEGYFGTPTVALPVTSGTVANITPSMDYGYGFPKMPHGDSGTLLIDLLNREPFNIGTISSLTSINPGKDYDASPFVKIHNKYVAGFERSDFLVNLSTRVGSFIPGEMVFERFGTDIFPKGIVIADYGTTVIIKRIFFNTAFTESQNLIGAISGSTGRIGSYSDVQDSPVMGDNAHVGSDVVSADGIISEVDVIDSGWGYIDSDEVSLESGNNIYVVNGKINNITHGKGEGYWASTTSHLNSDSKIQDSDYYQDFSYEVVSSVPFKRYESLLKGILHVAGSKMFGRFDKSTNIETDFETSSSISVT